MAYLECTTADLNYAVGDIYAGPISQVIGDDNRRPHGIAWNADNANITIGYNWGTATNVKYEIFRDNSFTGVAELNRSNWKLVAVPYKIG